MQHHMLILPLFHTDCEVILPVGFAGFFDHLYDLSILGEILAVVVICLVVCSQDVDPIGDFGVL